jgi:hypothetical protein
MSEETSRLGRPVADRERDSGFALVLAILALLLLTFLGLTLATTTSTELQIATNYRWSQQAMANAEAGLEAAKIILRDSGGGTWVGILPSDRGATVTWMVSDGTPTPPPAPPPPGNVDTSGGLRGFENGPCDIRGGGVGYGAVLVSSTGPIQDRTTLFGQNLNGAVTIWVRRGVRQNTNGTYNDDSSNNAAVITAEGVAPFTSGSGGAAIAQANQAVHVLQASYLMQVGNASACTSYNAQGGGGVSGSGFWGCGITENLASAFDPGGALAGAGGTGASIAGVK